MPLTTTEVERRKLLDDYMSKLFPRFSRIGFVKAGRLHFTRKVAEGSNDFVLNCRSCREAGVLRVAVTPIIHTNFPAVKRVASFMGLPEGQPSVGAALGIYTPYRSMKEWWIDSAESIDLAAKETWDDIETWGVLFWNQTESIAKTIESVPLLRRGPHVESEAAMRYLIWGLDSAVEFISSRPEQRISPSEKSELIKALKALDSKKELLSTSSRKEKARK